MINKELLELKNEFLKELREIETKLDKKLENHSIILDIKNQEQEDKINLTVQKNEQLYDTMLNQKLKLEKISELNISQKKLNDMLISHEMRINTLITENKKLIKNYDKIITDLSVPGYIGSSCMYRNISEYIQNNINEIQKIKNDKDYDKKLTEDIKNKLDNFMKNMLTLVDNTVTRCNQYTDNKQVYLENILKNKLIEFNEKNMDLRTQIFSNFSKANQQVEKFGIKLNELKNIENKINNEIKIQFQEIKNNFEEDKNYLKQNIDEILQFRNSLNDIIDKKLDNFNKNQKNKLDFKLNKAGKVLSPNIKSFTGTNNREDLMNQLNIKSTMNINNLKNENFKNKTIKRYTMINLN